jgi:hypothetical protein
VEAEEGDLSRGLAGDACCAAAVRDAREPVRPAILAAAGPGDPSAADEEVHSVPSPPGVVGALLVTLFPPPPAADVLRVGVLPPPPPTAPPLLLPPLVLFVVGTPTSSASFL